MVEWVLYGASHWYSAQPHIELYSEHYAASYIENIWGFAFETVLYIENFRVAGAPLEKI